MRTRWIIRLGMFVGVTTVTAFAFAPTALAEESSGPLTLRQSNVTATGPGVEQKCDFGPARSADRDVWVFVLPGNKGDFTSLKLTYDDGDGNVVVTVPGAKSPADGAIKDSGAPGTSKAWVSTPKGWTLVTGTATINGTTPQPYFNLTHTCPAGSGGDTPGGDTPGGDTPGGDTPKKSATPAAPGLPVTGSSVPAVVGVGLVLLATGTALLLGWRRRRNVKFTA